MMKLQVMLLIVLFIICINAQPEQIPGPTSPGAWPQVHLLAPFIHILYVNIVFQWLQNITQERLEILKNVNFNSSMV